MEKQIERQPACKPEVGIEKQFLRTTEFFNLEGVTLDIVPPGAVEPLNAEAAATLDMPPSTLTKAETIENNAVDSEALSHIIPPTILMPTFIFNIEGMEATQATQFYTSSHNRPASHDETDNAVPLIERKHLVIRVYPNLVKPWRQAAGAVQGEVWFKRTDIAGQPYRKAVVLNGSTAGRRAATIDRGNANHTLNFRIPDFYARGKLVVYSRCKVLVAGQWKYTPWLGRLLTFVRVPVVRIRAHGVHYHRNGILKAAPPLSDFIATSVYLRKTWPMSRFNFLSYDVIHFAGDLTNTAGGGCGQGWNALWRQLRALYNASGQDANHYALMKKGIPTTYGGCGGGNVGASFVGDGSIMAQELGHALGRSHAPGCDVGGPDPSYPHYTHPQSAAIGEFGMDYATGKVYTPSDSNDFMGYCGNPWVSPCTYRALISDINHQPSPITVEASRCAKNLCHSQEYLYLDFGVSSNGDVDLQSGFSMEGPGGNSNGGLTKHSIELQDGQGRVLWAKRLVLKEAHQSHDDSHTWYSEAIPMLSEVARLVFKCGHADGPTIIDIPKKAPTVNIETLKFDTSEAQSGTVPLKWTTQCGKDEQVTSIVRYTNDGGETWRPLVMALGETEYKVNLDQLPSGKNCKLQVMASTLLRTTMAETEMFAVSRTPAQAMISPVPQDGQTQQSEVVELAGCAYSPDGCADEDDCRWNSSLDGDLGCGEYLIANNLTPGEHVISFSAPDGVGGSTHAEYTVQVLAQG